MLLVVNISRQDCFPKKKLIIVIKILNKKYTL